jgi:hypothetical protein
MLDASFAVDRKGTVEAFIGARDGLRRRQAERLKAGRDEFGMNAVASVTMVSAISTPG